MKPNTLFLRLALWGGILGSLLVCALIAFFYFAMMQKLENQAREHLSNKIHLIQRLLVEESNATAISRDYKILSNFEIFQDNLHIAISDKKSATLLASFSPIGSESLLYANSGSGEDPYFHWSTKSGTKLLSLAAESRLQDGRVVLAIVTADRSGDNAMQTYFLRMALLTIPIAIILVVIGAWWITRHGLMPLLKLRQAASSVTTHDLSYRIDYKGLPAELSDLAIAFNKMLERLEGDVSRLFQFSGDLAHEMRTPISNLLGKTQVTLSKQRSTVDYRLALESNVEEFVRLSRLVDDMLFLTQVDNAQAALRWESVDLQKEAIRVAEFFELAAEERNVFVNIEGSAHIQADRVMVQRAISNLLSNAIRHTLHGGSVTVRIVKAAHAQIAVAVSNTGEGILPRHLAHLFERFYRADPCRSRAEGGTGLGLAIVKSIMSLHEGNVRVESGPCGITTFTLFFNS